MSRSMQVSEELPRHLVLELYSQADKLLHSAPKGRLDIDTEAVIVQHTFSPRQDLYSF
jgi:hypothetical protein